MKHGSNTDRNPFLPPCSIRVSSVFHPWLRERVGYFGRRTKQPGDLRMRMSLNRPLATALLLTGALSGWPLPSRAQFAPNPNQPVYPAARTQAAANAGPPPAATGGSNNTFRYNPFQVSSGGG